MAELNEPLSDRELDVLTELVQEGGTNKEIGAALHISQHTVKVHLRRIYTKLGVSSRTEASMAALERGLVSLPGLEISEPPPAVEPDPPAADETTPTADADDQPEETTPTAEAAVEPPPVAAISTDPPADTQPSPPPNVPTVPLSAGQRWVMGGLLTAVLVLLGVVAYGQFSATVPPAPTPNTALFEEQQIADTRWYTARPAEAARTDAVLVGVGVTLYHVGGQLADGTITADTRLYNPQTTQWQAGVDKPTAVAGAAAASLFGEIYVIGGQTAEGPTTAAEAYSPAQDAWRPIADLPTAVTDAVAVADGGYLYLLGGRGADGRPLADAYSYDPAANAWRVLADLPQPVADAAGGAMTGGLYVAGGVGPDEEPTADCHRFDPLTEAWSACAPLSVPRSGAGSAVVVNKLYLLGGETTADYGERYDAQADVWQVVPMPMLAETAVTGWPAVGVANIESRIYLVGGRLSGTPTADTFVYAPLVYQSFIPAVPSGE